MPTWFENFRWRWFHTWPTVKRTAEETACGLCAQSILRNSDCVFDAGAYYCNRCVAPAPWPADDLHWLLSLAREDVPLALTPTTEPHTSALGFDSAGAPVIVEQSARARHTYIIGKSGSGKSSLLRNLVIEDMDAGRGVILLDPHGDTAQGLLAFVPPERRNDVIYFCPADETCPAFNVLAVDAPPYKLAADLVSAFRMFFGDSWGHQMEALLRSSLLTLLIDRQHQEHALAEVRRVLVDVDYREELVARCPDPVLASFWRDEYPKMTKDAARPILTRLSSLVVPGSPSARLFSSTAATLDLPAIMNGRKILLCNLSKGQLGDASAFLIGGLITTAIAQAALARVTIPEADRVPVNFYVDEFQNFAIESFESILSEARKYRVALTLAHQYLAQIADKLRAAVFGNVAVVVSLVISAADAAIMCREISAPNATVYKDAFGRRITGADVAARWRQDYRIIARGILAQPNEPHPEHLRRPWPPDNRPGNRVIVLGYYKRWPNIRDDGSRSTWWYAQPVGEKLRMCVRDLRGRVEEDQRIRTGVYTPLLPYVFDDLSPCTTSWPSTDDLLSLQPLAGFVKIGTSKSTRAFVVRHPEQWTPPRLPNAATMSAVLDQQRRQHENGTTAAGEKKRRAQSDADERNATDATDTMHPNEDIFDAEAPEPVHSPHAELEQERPTRRLPRPRRRS